MGNPAPLFQTLNVPINHNEISVIRNRHLVFSVGKGADRRSVIGYDLAKLWPMVSKTKEVDILFNLCISSLFCR